jgi:peroxiredoxin
MTVTRRVAIAAGAFWALASQTAFADAPFGPKVGTTAPSLGALADQDDVKKPLADLMGPKGVVLMFYRSAGWCPFCQVQLIAMNEGVREFEKRGYKIVGVSYEPPQVNKDFTARRAITYKLLADPGSQVIDQWGLRDPAYQPGSKAFGVPRPIIFVIDKKNTIRASLAEESFRNRPPVSEVLKAIDALK